MDGNCSSNIDKRPCLKTFLKFLEEKCKISNPWFISKETNEIKLRSFNGNERELIFEKIFNLKLKRDTKLNSDKNKRKKTKKKVGINKKMKKEY